MFMFNLGNNVYKNAHEKLKKTIISKKKKNKKILNL
jgi:hypothetical protein